jgi:glucosyl-dolichyl phosphate glucuronosyltransferase
MTLALSIVLPTYNRADEVHLAIGSALDQTADAELYELIVVDNASTDGTPDVLQRIVSAHPGRIRALRELRQGVSYARQAGIDAARGDIVAFFDDDVRVSQNWVETILKRFDETRGIDCVGGKVLPLWTSPPPAWLTPDHAAPLGLQDLGEQSFISSDADRRGLISANLACRRDVLHQIGGFSPRFQRVKDGIGSLEDDDWIRRFWRAGKCGLYAPDLLAWTTVPPSRLTRAYHRRWHLGHGRFYASLRADEIERTSTGAPFGVPAHLYRAAIVNAGRWMKSMCSGRRDAAFTQEVKLRFFAGFFSARAGERTGFNRLRSGGASPP